MFNFIIKAVANSAKNAADRAAIKGFSAGETGFGAVERAAAAGRKACEEGKKAHQAALNKRADEWDAFQANLLAEKEEKECYAVDKNGHRIEVTVE